MRRRIAFGRRWIACGALIGLLVVLGFALTMPARQVHVVYIPAPHGRLVAVYGALQPYAPRALSSPTVQRSPRTVRDGVLGLIAGGLVAYALVTVVRPGRPRRRV